MLRSAILLATLMLAPAAAFASDPDESTPIGVERTPGTTHIGVDVLPDATSAAARRAAARSLAAELARIPPPRRPPGFERSLGPRARRMLRELRYLRHERRRYATDAAFRALPTNLPGTTLGRTEVTQRPEGSWPLF